MAQIDIDLAAAQATIAGGLALQSGLPIGAAGHWNAIAAAWTGISTRGGLLDLPGAVALEAAHRSLGADYSTAAVTETDVSVAAAMTQAAATYVAEADSLAAWISVVGAPTVPTTPLAVRAVPASSAITISWSPPSYDGNSTITGYKVTRLDNSTVQIVDGSTFTSTFNLLTNGTTYSFNVKATNAFGDSVASTTVTANPVGVSRRYDYGPSGVVTPTVLDSLTQNFESSPNSTSADTNSITPPANQLITVAVQLCRADTTNAAAPTLTGCGLTWVNITPTGANYDDSGANRARMYLFRALGAAPTTGAVTVHLSGTYVAVQTIITAWAGADVSGVHGSGAIVQVQGALAAATANPTITLGSAIGAGNVTAGFTCSNGTVGTVGHQVAGSGYTELAALTQFFTVGNDRLTSFEWRADGQTIVDWTQGAGDWGVIAFEIKAGVDAPVASWLPAATGTTSLGSVTDTHNTALPIEIRSGIYGLDPAGGFGIKLPLETGDWDIAIGGAEWVYNASGARVYDITVTTDAGTVHLARSFDPFAAFGNGIPYTQTFTIRIPSGGHGATLAFPEITGHAFVSTLSAVGIQKGSKALSPDIPGGGGGGGGGGTLVPLGNSTAAKAKSFVNTHWAYIDRPGYSNTAAFTAKAIELTNGNIRDGVPGKIVGGDQTIGTRFWQWVVANNLKIIYISPSTAFANFSSHTVNRQVMEAVPGAAAQIIAVEAPNETDFQFSSDAQRQAEISAFASAWAGYPLVAPSIGNWTNTAAYQLYANDSRFTYGNSHAYMGTDFGPTDAKMAQATSLAAIIVGNRPKMITESGHGTYTGGTGPGAGNPPLSEDEQADSYLKEMLEWDRFGARCWAQYELMDEDDATNDYEMRLGSWHSSLAIKPSGTARKLLKAFYTSDPAIVTSLDVTLSGLGSNTRYNLRQRNGAWLLAIWEQANSGSTALVTLTFGTAKTVASSNLRTGAAIGSGSAVTTFDVTSTVTPTMVVIQ
jgi:hypothetical protein